MESDPQDDDLLLLAKLSLSLNNFSQAKSYADLALQSNLLAPSDQFLADQILAVANVHIAAAADEKSRNRRIVADPYAILQLGTHDHNIFTPDSLLFNYRTLVHLLDPELNKFHNAAEALKLVSEAYEVLSDPEKKSLFDDEIRSGSEFSAPGPTFWTVCRSCFRVHQYERAHEGKELTCAVCECVFVAAELPEEPPVVEGTDMYYCTWGFFPVGFVGGYRFEWGPQEEEEEEMGTPPPETVKRERQTARKTVRPINFSARLESCEGDDDDAGDGVDG